MKNKMVVIGDIYCAGVYSISEKESGIVRYIGSSLECNDALSRHLHYLKRGLYKGTNKALLGELYDLNELLFTVIHKSELDEKIKDMSLKDKNSVNESLSVLEKMYIDLYKDTVVNSQLSVKRHSSNQSKITTFKRRKSQIGSKNANVKYSEELIANILYLKIEGYKPKKILELLLENDINTDIKSTYLSSIGITKWLFIDPIKPSWIA